MSKQPDIRKIVAALMLLVFSFSITPTILLHNWFTNHTDSVKKPDDKNQEQVAAKRFYCHCDNIVAESPFTRADSFVVPVPEKTFSAKQDNRVVHPATALRLYFSLRAPPVA